MTNADKMFEELGYEKLETFFHITYKKEYETHTAYIDFNEALKIISTTITEKEPKGNGIWQDFNAQNIKAIYEKVLELGWLDNDEQHIPRID